MRPIDRARYPEATATRLGADVMGGTEEKRVWNHAQPLARHLKAQREPRVIFQGLAQGLGSQALL